MSLAHKLYKIGQLVAKEEIKEMIEVTEFKDIGSYTTLQIDFTNGKVTINSKGIDFDKTMFSRKIGGSGDGIYYLYPNFVYQKKDLYKSFKTQVSKTLEHSIMLYANEVNKKLAQPLWEYIQNYKDDVLGLSSYESGNYFLIITIDGKTFYELMPEIWDNYYDDFVEIFERKITKKEYEQLFKINPKKVYRRTEGNKKEYYEILFQDSMDFITHNNILCGYNPDIKFFTMDNYNDALKPQIIDKLPMSKETAKAIKKGWMYAINHLKFNHNDLEYIIIPSMVNYDGKVYKELLKLLKKSGKIDSIASREDSFMRRLYKQIEEFDQDKINSISLDILFTEVNRTNLSVKIFATLEDVIPSRINQVVKEMRNQKISDSNFIDVSKKEMIYLKDYFGNAESLAKAKKLKGLDNRIKQEKIALAKILLGYEKIKYEELLKCFEQHRETHYNFKDKKVEKRLVDSKNKDAKIKEWLEYPDSFFTREDRTLQFLKDINAIQKRRVVNERY